MEVQNCTSSRIRGAIQLHHVSFVNNTLIGGAGLAMQSPSCFELELVDFVFENNTCDGHCGVILSRRNRLRDIVVQRNKPSDSGNANTTVFYAAPGSETSLDRMNSSENRCSSLEVQDGFLDMSRAVFDRNSIAVGENGANSTSLLLTSATVSMKKCRFQQNSSPTGGAISMSGSNVTFTDSIFVANTAANGGVMELRDDSVVSIQSCRFFANRVSQRGGVLLGIKSRLIVADSLLENNSANTTGGCVSLKGPSNLTMSSTVMMNNTADYGAALALEENTSGNVMNSTFLMNSAFTSGGAVYVEESLISIQKCQFANGSANVAGGILSFSSNVFAENTFASDMSASQHGGFFFGRTSEIRLSYCSFLDNRADGTGGVLGCHSNCSFSDTGSQYSGNTADFGGAISLLQNSSGIVTDCQFDKNSASTSGGAVYLLESVLLVQMCNFANGSTEAGGGIDAVFSNITVEDTSASDMSAVKDGGFITGRTAKIRLKDCTFSGNTANLSGGVLSCRPACSFSDTGSHYSRNTARAGGAIYLETSSSGIITDCQFDKNKALTFGGAVYIEESVLLVQMCNFANGSSEIGGGITTFSANITVEDTSASDMSAVELGGFIAGHNSEIRLSGCAFLDNRADGTGGVLGCHSNCSFSDTGSHYSGNIADTGGAISLESNSSGIVTDCQFDKNSASTSGGAVFVKVSVLSVQMCNFANGSAEIGGGIFSISSKITVEDTSASYMSAVQQGGFIVGRTSEIRSKDCSFLDNRADEAGGVIECDSDCSFLDTGSQYSGNTADTGGAIYLMQNSSGTIAGCQFDKNSASTSGGALYVQESMFFVQECHFANGFAQNGGGILATSANIFVWKSDAVGQSANDEGGFISALSESTVSVTRSSIIECRSRCGGVISLSRSVLEVNNTQISQCEAESDGGVIMGFNSSRLLCNGCTLADNNATRGGAIFFEYSYTQSISLQLDDSILQNNSAEYGGIHCKTDRKRGSRCSYVGGIQIAAETLSLLQNCRADQDECRVAAVVNTSMMDNRARSAGGAIFIDTVAALRLRCSDESKEQKTGFFSKKQWKTMKRLVSSDDICTSWKNNTAERYGLVVATFAFGVRKEIADEETDELGSVKGNNYTVHNHRSGEPIPTTILTLVDELGQGPAVGENNEDIKAVMSSPDGFLDGSVSRPLGIERANFSATGFVKPGNYKILIVFEGADLESFEMTVEVKPCDIGEVTSRNGTLCVSCNAVSFNFYPEEDMECHSCPENGDCTSQVILPNRGYWHRTPCSERVQKCFTAEACDGDKREEALRERTQDVQTCQFDDQYLQDYTEAQCREVSTVFDYGLPQASLGSQGHEGPLCGSCKESFGKSHSHLCEECRSAATDVVLVVLSFLVLLGLSSITVRSNLVSVCSSQKQQPTQATRSSAASTSTPAVPAERRIELAVVEAITEGGSTSSDNQEADTAQPSEDAELVKWKAVELFKVTLCFVVSVVHSFQLFCRLQ